MTSPRRGRRPIPPEVQRQRLLDAARRALRESDFGSVRVTDVTRAAGMSTRSFYDHFASKEDLLLGMIREAGDRLVAELEAIFARPELEPRDRIDLGLGAYLGAFAGTPLDLEKLGDGASARVQQALRHYVREVGIRVEAELARLHRAGATPRPPDPLTLEVLLQGLLGLASRYVSDGRADELDSLRPPLRDFLLRVWS